MATNKQNGYLLYESDSIAVIATGFARKSANPKTGNMVQVWILARHVNPVEAVKTGQNSINCIDCKHMGQNGKNVTCYVRVANAPLGIWKAYTRGNYPYLPIEEYARVIHGRTVRFGAYGDPVLIPIAIVRELARVASGHTGYTHQWSKPQYQEYRAFVMASVDTVAEYHAAKSMQWRTFRVRNERETLLTREIACPASEEMGKRTTCEACRLCSGAIASDPRKDIAIIVHGSGARKFELIQIGA